MPLIFSLPNLHPAVVHFPAALVPVAALLDLAALSLRSKTWLDRAAATVWVLAALGTGGAYWAGRQAADSLTVPPRIQPHIVEHSDWAWWTLWAVVLLALARLVLAAWDADSERLRRLPLRWLVWMGSLGGVALVFYTADLGGGLVYQHEVAVGTVQERAPEDESLESPETDTEDRASVETGPSSFASSPRDRWVEEEDGTRVWRPKSGDKAALGPVLGAAEGSSLDAVTAATGTSGDGLTLRVDGRAVLVLPGEYADVQVEADLDLSGFEGVAGVVHRVADASNFGAFSVASSGDAVLLDVEDGDPEELATASVEGSGAPRTLAVSAVGSHLKGFVDGEQVTHGHTGEDPAGGAGLLLDGRGEIRVLEMRVIPLG